MQSRSVVLIFNLPNLKSQRHRIAFVELFGEDAGVLPPCIR